MTASPTQPRRPGPGEHCALCGRELHQATYYQATPIVTARWICGW